MGLQLPEAPPVVRGQYLLQIWLIVQNLFTPLGPQQHSTMLKALLGCHLCLYAARFSLMALQQFVIKGCQRSGTLFGCQEVFH